MLRNSLLLALLFAASTSVVQATTIYKWVDKEGVTHFSQDPPPTEIQTAEQLDSTELEPTHIGSVTPKAAAKAAVTSNPSVADVKTRNAEQAASICEQAQFQLKVLQTHSRLQRQDPKTGEVIEMSAEEREQQINTQQERITQFCTKP